MNYHIDRMLYALVRTGALPAKKKADAKKVLQRYWRDKEAYIWGVDDVLSLDSSLTEKEAREILHGIKHDASIGVNWDVIQANIDFFKAEKEESNAKAKK